MSKKIVVYNLADKSIIGYYGFSKPATADFYPLDPATQGKIELPLDHPSIGEQHKWRVEAGNLVLKAEVSVLTDKTQITADGIDEATITFTGLVKDSLIGLGGELTHVVSTSDPVLALTSDVPKVFEFRVLDEDHWSEPFIVEAL